MLLFLKRFVYFIYIYICFIDRRIKMFQIQNEMTNTINILKNNKNSTLNDEESNIRKQYSCTECKYECFDMTTYLFHIQIHKNTKIISCSICGIKFTNKRNLNKHNKRYHVKVKRNSNFKCSSKRICFPHKKIHRSEEILTLFDNKARIKSLNES